MEFADFDTVDAKELENLFSRYYPAQLNYTFRQKVLYIASEYARINQETLPELEDKQFAIYYTKDDETLAINCQRLLGVNCRGNITRLEAVYLCTLYWSNSLRLDLQLSEETEDFLKQSLINSSKSTSHLEWIAVALLDSDTAAVGLKRLQKRDFGFKLEFEPSSSSPGNQIKNKLRSVLLLNRVWQRSVAVKSVTFLIDDTRVSFYNTEDESHISLVQFLKLNPKKIHNIQEEMKNFIEAFDYTDIIGIETSLDKMKVNFLGQIYIDDVTNIRTQQMPGHYKTVVLDNWNERLISLGYEPIRYNY